MPIFTLRTYVCAWEIDTLKRNVKMQSKVFKSSSSLVNCFACFVNDFFLSGYESKTFRVKKLSNSIKKMKHCGGTLVKIFLLRFRVQKSNDFFKFNVHCNMEKLRWNMVFLRLYANYWEKGWKTLLKVLNPLNVCFIRWFFFLQ